MDKKNLAIISVVAIAVIVILAALFFTQNNGPKEDGKDSGGDVPVVVTYDYYVYLDGMEDINGWYTSKATNALDGFKNALDAGGVGYTINNGFIKSIVGYTGDSAASKGFGVFYYTSSSLAFKTADYFFAFAAVDKIPGNIIYVSYGDYTFDENYNASYAVNPKTNATLMTSGPFSESAKYAPLPYSGTTWFYLDGMGDINGWYKGNSSSNIDSFKSAMDAAGIAYSISDLGWINYIGSADRTGDASNGYSVFLYGSNSVSNPWKFGYFSGPALADAVSGIIYISFGGYTYNAETGSVDYDVNPYVNDSVVAGGPFAVAS